MKTKKNKVVNQKQPKKSKRTLKIIISILLVLVFCFTMIFTITPTAPNFLVNMFSTPKTITLKSNDLIGLTFKGEDKSVKTLKTKTGKMVVIQEKDLDKNVKSESLKIEPTKEDFEKIKKKDKKIKKDDLVEYIYPDENKQYTYEMKKYDVIVSSIPVSKDKYMVPGFFAPVDVKKSNSKKLTYAEYLEKNANKDLIGKGQIKEIGKFKKTKTYADMRDCEPKTIDNLNIHDENGEQPNSKNLVYADFNLENVYATENGKYVMFLMEGINPEKILDVSFCKESECTQPLKNCQVDKKTGIVYIPKEECKKLEKNPEFLDINVQGLLQTDLLKNIDFNKCSTCTKDLKRIPLIINDNGKKTYFDITYSIVSNEIQIPLSKLNIKAKDIKEIKTNNQKYNKIEINNNLLVIQYTGGVLDCIELETNTKNKHKSINIQPKMNSAAASIFPDGKVDNWGRNHPNYLPWFKFSDGIYSKELIKVDSDVHYVQDKGNYATQSQYKYAGAWSGIETLYYNAFAQEFQYPVKRTTNIDFRLYPYVFKAKRSQSPLLEIDSNNSDYALLMCDHNARQPGHDKEQGNNEILVITIGRTDNYIQFHAVTKCKRSGDQTGVGMFVGRVEDPKGYVGMSKYPRDQRLLQNKMYSNLKGAKFQIYETGKTYTLNNMGTDSKSRNFSYCYSEKLKAYKTYYVRETKAPANYHLDDDSYHGVYIKGQDHVAWYDAVDSPITITSNSFDIYLSDYDFPDNPKYPNEKPLSDGIFEIKYYDNTNGSSNKGRSPFTTIRVRTDKNGKAYIDKNHLVSGYEGNYNKLVAPTNGLPLGSYLVQEVKAPTDYVLEGQKTNKSYSAPVHTFVFNKDNCNKAQSLKVKNRHKVELKFNWSPGSRNLKEPFGKDTRFNIDGKKGKINPPNSIKVCPDAEFILPKMPIMKSNFDKDGKNCVLGFKPLGWYTSPDRKKCVSKDPSDIQVGEKYFVKHIPHDYERYFYVFYDVAVPTGIKVITH